MTGNHDQLDLIELLWGGPTPLVKKFRDFHCSHPEVYEALVRFTREAVAGRRGRRRVGIAAVYERARWELNLRAADREPAALNNSYKAFYARLIMAQEADLQGVFETRASVADHVSGEAA